MNNKRATALSPLAVRQILPVAIGIALFNFGCTQFKAVTALQGQAVLASQCPLTTVAEQANSISAFCENSSSYVCESQTFSPNVANSKGVEQQCANVAGLGQVCLDVDVATISISAASTSHTQVHCSNTEVTGANGFAYQSGADSLEEALAIVVNKCRTKTL